MREITHTFKLYTFSELSRKAKEHAYITWLASGNEYGWDRENKASLDAFVEFINRNSNDGIAITIIDYDYISRAYISADIDVASALQRMDAMRAYKWLENNIMSKLRTGKVYRSKRYPTPHFERIRRSKIMLEDCCTLTGVWVDDELLKPIREFMDEPRKFSQSRLPISELLRRCLCNFIEQCAADYEHCTTMDYYSELCDANEWEFYEDGTFYSGKL